MLEYIKKEKEVFTMENEKNTNNTFSILSLVMGIISIVLACCCPYVPLITGILAVVFAFLSKRENEYMDGLSKAGLICGICGFVLSIAVIVFSFVFTFTNYDSIMPYYEEILSDVETL